MDLFRYMLCLQLCNTYVMLDDENMLWIDKRKSMHKLHRRKCDNTQLNTRNNQYFYPPRQMNNSKYIDNAFHKHQTCMTWHDCTKSSSICSVYIETGNKSIYIKN
jgi:hypothetical protein